MVFPLVTEDDGDDDGDAQEELGGLFRVRQPDGGCKHKADAMDCSRFPVEAPHDWDLEEVRRNRVFTFGRNEKIVVEYGEPLETEAPNCNPKPSYHKVPTLQIKPEF